MERLDAPEPPTPAERRGHAVALVAAALLHLLIPASLFVFYWFWPPPKIPTAVQEIPVEVVVEQPPPKPKPPEEKPKPPPEPEVEKPAYDAPAAATKDDVNREAPDKETKAKAAPEAPPPPVPGAPPKAEAKAPTPEPADQPKAEAAPSHELAPSPEGELPADATPKEEESPAEAAAPAVPPERPKAPAGAPIPTFEDLPQYEFARSVAKSPIAGGSAESRYNTILYGMIMARLPEGRALLHRASRRGVVDFYVDEAGNLVGHKLVASSGSPNLDIAVMNAITAAAPYPAPPHWSPIGLTFEFGRGPRPRGAAH